MVNRSFIWSIGSASIVLACYVSSATATLFTTSDRPIPGTDGIVLRTGVDLSGLDLASLDAGRASLTNASLVGTNLQYGRLMLANLEGADFTDANVREANLGEITREQLYSTASYGDKDLYGISIRPPALPVGETWDFSGQSLHDAYLIDDFRNADFTNADLRNAALTGNFTGANWTNTQLKNISVQGDFSNTDWSNRDLSNSRIAAVITDSDFIGADFTNARFGDTFQGCFGRETPCGSSGNPSYADADFTNAIIDRATFAGPTLGPVQFYSTANYQAGDLRNIRIIAEGALVFLNPAIVDGWDFSNQDLTEAVILNSRAREADFSQANLPRADLARTDFTGANFAEANLAFAKIPNSKLVQTNFDGADLSYSSLYNADFSTSSFEYANLVGADLEGVDVVENTQVNMRGAKLQNAILRDTDLDKFAFDATTEFNQWTIFPNGFDAEAAGMTYRPTEPGDLNANYIVDANDITIMATRLQKRGTEATGLNRSYADKVIDPFDFTRDGMVDDADLEALLDLAGAIPGDTDLSGSVGFDDFLRLSENFGGDGGWEDGDFSSDGEVAFRDFTILSANFGQQTSVQTAAVPEPSAQSIAALGILVLLTFRYGRA